MTDCISGCANIVKVSDALGVILGPQYMAEDIWNPRGKRKSGHSSFIFADSQGRFSSFLMRLEGRTGKAQGYTNMIYHLDVKATEKQQAGSFQLSQAELDRVCMPPSRIAVITSYLLPTYMRTSLT